MAFDISTDFFLDFFHALNINQVSYMLIGGYAVNFYGYNRATADMDIWIKANNENRDRFIEALVTVGYEREEIKEIADDDFTIHQCYTFGSVPNHIDVLTFIHKDILFDDAYNKRVQHQLENKEIISFISLDTLIDAKTRSTRPKDWADVLQLQKIEQQKNI